VNYAVRFSDPVTALTARRADRACSKSSPRLENFSLPSTRIQGLTSLQPWHPSSWHPSSWLMQPLRLVFSFDHLTSALFGPSTSLNAPSLADPRCRRFSAPDHTQTLLPLPLLPSQNPPALLRARNLPDLRIRTGSPLRPGIRPGAGPRLWA
jgi:hypothetical protein